MKINLFQWAEDASYRDIAVYISHNNPTRPQYRIVVSLDKENGTIYEGDWAMADDATDAPFYDLEGEVPPEVLAAFESVKEEAYRRAREGEPNDLDATPA